MSKLAIQIARNNDNIRLAEKGLKFYHKNGNKEYSTMYVAYLENLYKKRMRFFDLTN